MRNYIRNRIFSLLQNIHYGELTIQDNGFHFQFGKKDPRYPSVTVNVNDTSIYRAILLEGINGAGTAFVDGHWECDNLTDLFNLFFINFPLFKKLDTGIPKLITKWKSIFYLFRKNSIDRAKQNVIKHYDLGNGFFKQFLDKKMMYSCAIFDETHIDLDSAAENKLRIICQKLQLNENDHLLEIGSGWGGLAVYAATHYGCRVTTTTISKQQYDFVSAYINQNNLSDKITLLNLDYRLLEGSFDKIVSVEMIEAVGFKYFPTYFEKINSLLKPNGKFLLQAITINDENYNRAKHELDFMNTYIFPGGCLPSMAEIYRCLKLYTTMQCIGIEDITKHYPPTLKIWQNNFKNKLSVIKSFGFNDHFIRMWIYYFSYCQAGFEHHYIQDYQLLMNKVSI